MKWGHWEFDSEAKCLVHHVWPYYEIDLEEIDSSAAILDWIFQLLRKDWVDANCMYDLLRAFRATLSPQANYCSFGCDHRADGGQLAAKFAESLK